MMIVCTCGNRYANEKEWRVHYMIGLPGLIQTSRLTHITEAQEEMRKIERETYIKEHIPVETGRGRSKC